MWSVCGCGGTEAAPETGGAAGLSSPGDGGRDIHDRRDGAEPCAVKIERDARAETSAVAARIEATAACQAAARAEG